jgi:signal transduction histidine kinase
MQVIESDSVREPWTYLRDVVGRLAAAQAYDDTVTEIARLRCPRPGDWCVLDLVSPDGSVRRIPASLPDPERQDLARRLGAHWPPVQDGNSRPEAGPDSAGAPAIDRLDALRGSLDGPAETRAILDRLGVTQSMTVPLVADGTRLGSITYVAGAGLGPWDEADVGLAVALAACSSLALSGAERTEVLRSSVVLRDQVLGYVSHDLKNPLGAITLVASVLKRQEEAITDGPGGGPSLRAANTILTATEHMQRLIEDLLEVALIGTGGVSIRRRAVDPAEEVEGVRAAYEGGLVAKSLRLETAVEDGLPSLFADAGRLRQVFENLLENAAKFTAPGGVITIGAAAEPGFVRFRVTDTGRGIHADELPRLFERFWMTRRSGVTSTGFGLTICRGIVEAHGGSIRAESAVGEGSTFHFRIPIGEPDPDAVAEA